jgi:hypothetical protein
MFLLGLFNNKIKYNIALMVIGLLCISKANAWVYPEHRRISILAIQQLSQSQQLLLQQVWQEIRKGNETRLSEQVFNLVQTKPVTQIDFAAWPAIAGDHSCSPANMLETILKTDWILKVATIGDALEQGFASVKNNAQLINTLRKSDMQLMRADNTYATRAGANSVHFLLPRQSVTITSQAYLQDCIAPGASLNAMGAYAYYHQQALLKARLYASLPKDHENKSALLMGAMADEAFAIHFLQDAFAAGHTAGSWGNASQQKGTHDYYNEHGLAVDTWDGKKQVVHGDAYLKKEEAAFTAQTVAQSLAQVLASISTPELNIPVQVSASADSFNICSNLVMPTTQYDLFRINAIFQTTIVPGLANGDGALPRFRAEIGSFIGVSTALIGNSLAGGFAQNQNTIGSMGGIEGNIRFGIGLNGVLNQSGDGLAFIQLGWRQDGASSNNIINSNPSVLASNSITSAIPARAGYNFRIRMPFYLIPGDLLLAIPALLFTSPKTLSKMGVAAVNGGLVPWQSVISTKIGRFQMVLGREVGVTLYGLRTPRDYILVPTANSSVAVEYRSTKLEFPFLEYRPSRKFSQDQSSSILIQLSAGVDMPHKAKSIFPVGEPTPELKPIWFSSIRILFNWRHYL